MATERHILTLAVAAAFAGCNAQPSSPPAAPPPVAVAASVAPIASAAPVTSVEPAVAPASPPSTSPAPACVASTTLPPLSSENAAYVAAVAVNVSNGLRFGSCAAMVGRDPTGPADLYGRAMYVACGPPRICSVGQDARRGTTDDACAALDSRIAGVGIEASPAPRGGQKAPTRRFLAIDAAARPGCESPEAAIVHFFASLIRDDGSVDAVLPEPGARSAMLIRKLAKIARFRIHAARLEDLSCAPTSCTFKVWLDTSMREGSFNHHHGVDSGVVQLMDGHWLMTRPPT